MGAGALVAMLFLLLAVPGAAAPDGEEMKRQREMLRLGATESRRESAAWLGRNGTAESVPALVGALRDADRAVRLLSENAIWHIWMRSGEPAIDSKLQIGSEHLQERRFREAVEVFDEIVRQAPGFAEGYNKRATAFYYLGDYERSMADIRQTLERNRYHFGALSGAGLCMMALHEPALALHYFEQALAINPNLAGIGELVEQLRRMTKEQMM